MALHGIDVQAGAALAAFRRAGPRRQEAERRYGTYPRRDLRPRDPGARSVAVAGRGTGIARGRRVGHRPGLCHPPARGTEAALLRQQPARPGGAGRRPRFGGGGGIRRARSPPDHPGDRVEDQGAHPRTGRGRGSRDSLDQTTPLRTPARRPSGKRPPVPGSHGGRQDATGQGTGPPRLRRSGPDDLPGDGAVQDQGVDERTDRGPPGIRRLRRRKTDQRSAGQTGVRGPVRRDREGRHPGLRHRAAIRRRRA